MEYVGIIGGSGLDDPSILKSSKEIKIKTPYGSTSSTIKSGKIGDIDVFILARHGRNHSIMPTNVNFRANIWALKELGCTCILASTAVGSLKEEIEPGHIVLPNQFIDFTKNRDSTFFDKKEVVHTEMADPFCKEIIDIIHDTSNSLGIISHRNKTVITIEGPRFSTKAESKMFRAWGADIINMSSCPEVALSKELGLKYASVAMTTDYDCWKEDEETVSWELIKKIMRKNSSNVCDIFMKTIPRLRDLD